MISLGVLAAVDAVNDVACRKLSPFLVVSTQERQLKLVSLRNVQDKVYNENIV